MGSSDFEIVERSFDVPFRARALHAGYVMFQAGPLSVYIRPGIAAAIRDRAAAAAPRETGGLLGGRILRDDRGHYVVVTGMATAPPTAGEFGSFNLSPDETEKLRQVLSERHPSADVIGWWHSHGAPSSYSGTDRGNQAIWTDPRHIGLLVFAQGTPWAKLYVGPQSSGPFPPAGPPPGNMRKKDGSPLAPDETRAEGTWQQLRLGPRSVSWRPRRAAVMILAALAILLVGAAGGRALRSGPAPVKRQIVISCAFTGEVTASCRTHSKGTAMWDINGTTVKGASIQFLLSGTRVIHVTIEGGRGR
jgi:proteasome lid subunit RPN8/RPN11